VLKKLYDQMHKRTYGVTDFILTGLILLNSFR